MVGLKPESEGVHIGQRLEQQSGANQQHQGECNLGRHQDVSNPVPASARRRRARPA